ncbi:expressed unknown protein [Seminavis robusta]|uniref:Uncharacterized protein n=1 Tax=Seminavis robusta TaxID=568900 RepID=A0A9N8EU39_9STRA|nr:expressed unknown protein [Seminavis robusta]|eukprot:Sro1577_g283600.1 n/a (310) ;mRNA; f:18285-19214
MFVAASTRVLAAGKHNGALARQLRLMSSINQNNSNNSLSPSQKRKEERRKFHSTSRRDQADAAEAKTEEQAPVATAESSGMLNRFIVTAEVTVSKIFPAGFGWQSSSILAENTLGYSPETMSFAMTTGLGDAVGVLGGHMLYYTAKKSAVDSSINLTAELHTGILLASAAFCSGTAWQPLVNALQGANLSFNEVFLGTWAGCGLAFYGGLRVGRTILSGYLTHVHEPTYENSKNDASLSVAIGGATGFFVGTDAAYLPEQNFLIKAVGIADGTPDLTGCAIAGSSTALGFVSAQSALNVVYPAKKCWND